ncbi:J domain-containing protein [Coraliomargarita sp. SDUM461004]|uniref:J domain-containing protein n=1 Tax=Thalassobacterium sedimentorum TaxID=3041258 RepID=A0ABU1AET7_9BACT|nr:J domain-containing protein [Coraliomargarita sp. SDUM461004]
MHSPSSSEQETGAELLVVDQAPYVRQALSACKRLRKELTKKQALLSSFEDDRRAFQLWLHGTHGATITQVRELHEEVNAYQFILHHLSRCAYESMEAVPALYQQLFRLKKAGMLHSYVPPHVTAKANDADDTAGEPRIDEDTKQDFYDRFYSERRSKDGVAEKHQAESSRKAQHDARLKSCYRQLAKRLHPDHSKLEEVVREQRWHEMQTAYHNDDLDGLLRIEAICDMDKRGLSEKLGLARLRDLAAYHKAHLLPIRDALRAAKQDIAYGFVTKGLTEGIEYAIAGNLKFEMIDLKSTISDLERAAKSIRKEALAQLRSAEIEADRARRAQERVQRLKASSQSDESLKSRQMTFF